MVVLSSQIYKRPLKDVIYDINAVIAEARLYIKHKIEAQAKEAAKKSEEETSITLAGESLQMSESFNSLRFALILSIILVYMIMAAQFESLLDPFIVMFAVPFTFTGVFLALLATNTTLSVITFLGIVMLMGIVVDNAIVLISYINILRARGLSMLEAVTTFAFRHRSVPGDTP